MTMFVRPAQVEDTEDFTSWYIQNPGQDLPVVTFPNTYTLCVFKHGKKIAFMPIQVLSFSSAQLLDSIVFNPEATDLEIAEGMRELIKHSITLGYLQNCGEIYFIGDHSETNKLAKRIFQEVEYPVYRLRLKDL